MTVTRRSRRTQYAAETANAKPCDESSTIDSIISDSCNTSSMSKNTPDHPLYSSSGRRSMANSTTSTIKNSKKQTAILTTCLSPIKNDIKLSEIGLSAIGFTNPNSDAFDFPSKKTNKLKPTITKTGTFTNNVDASILNKAPADQQHLSKHDIPFEDRHSKSRKKSSLTSSTQDKIVTQSIDDHASHSNIQPPLNDITETCLPSKELKIANPCTASLALECSQPCPDRLVKANQAKLKPLDQSSFSTIPTSSKNSLVEDMSSLGDLDALFNTPVKPDPSLVGAKRVTLLKPSNSASSISSMNSNSAGSVFLENTPKKSTSYNFTANDNDQTPRMRPKNYETKASRPDLDTASCVSVSPSKSVQSDCSLSSMTAPPRTLGGGLRLQCGSSMMSNEFSRSSRVSLRRKSNILTFGNNHTIMPSKSLKIEPTNRLAHMLQDQNNEDNDMGSKIDEGLSSSDEDGRKILSIHELREAGEVKRFKDEMDYFFDGMSASQGLKVRRLTTAELCKKLASSKFVSSIRAHSYTKQLFSLLVVGEDPVMRLYLTFILWILSRDVRNIEPLFFCQELPAAIVMSLTLSKTDDLFLNPPKQKGEKALIEELKHLISTSFRKTSETKYNKVSMFQLSLETLSEVSTVCGPLATRLRVCLAEHNAFSKLVQCLKLSALTDAPGQHDELKIYLRVFEFMTSKCFSNQLSDTDAELLFDWLFKLINHFKAQVQNTNSGQVKLLTQCMRIALHLDRNQAWPTVTSRHDWIRTILQLVVYNSTLSVHDKPIADKNDVSIMSEPVFELSVISISLLVNILESDTNSADLFTTIRLSQDCSMSGACMDDCICSLRLPAIVLIANMLEHCTDSSTKSVNCFIYAAHIAMLFGCVIKQSKKAKQWMTEKKWSDLAIFAVSLLDDFAQFHEQVVLEHEAVDSADDYGVAQTRNTILTVMNCLKENI
ncbi:hypothetical protein RTP6_001174 [Batrachochytrium dendrobatidis]